MKTIKLELENDEKCLINNILVEHCMGMGDVLRIQTTREAAEQVLKTIEASLLVQQVFFAFSVSGNNEISDSITNFLKPLLEQACDQLEGIKEELVKKGDPNGLQVVSTVEILRNIILKIPNQSLILVP